MEHYPRSRPMERAGDFSADSPGRAGNEDRGLEHRQQKSGKKKLYYVKLMPLWRRGLTLDRFEVQQLESASDTER